MINYENLTKNMAEVEKEIMDNCRETALAQTKYWLDEGTRKVARIELCRQAASLLNEAGVEIDLEYCGHGEYLDLTLGFVSHKPAARKALTEKLRQIRVALGCQLKPDGYQEYEADKGTIRVTMRPADYRQVSISWIEKIRPKKREDGRVCKFVTQRVRRLECKSA